jgi:soluble lytic murein transglycosylase
MVAAPARASQRPASDELSPAARELIEKMQQAVPKPMRLESEPEATRSPQSSRNLAGQQAVLRLDHARELLGSRYRGSIVRTGEKVTRINNTIYQWTHDGLPEAYRARYQRIAQTIIDEAYRREFDPVFLMAVIQSESGFNPLARGPVGEIGLMQLRPETARWIARHSGLKYRGAKTLKDPVANIRLGAAYLAYLREYFDSHARLYLAAYNMGQTNVKEALERHVWPKSYPSRVMQRYVGYYAELKAKLGETAEPLPMDPDSADDEEMHEPSGQ